MRVLSGKPRLKQGLFLACALTASLGLAACSDIGSSLDGLFGGDDEATADANSFPPDTGPSSAPPPAAMVAAPAAAVAGGVPVATITPVTITPGADTGTAVNKTIQSVRNQVTGLEGKLAANAARLSDLRNAGAAAAGSYQLSKAQITTRLQVGTTKGNPELVAQWNSAQSSLDSLSGNINSLNALGTDVANDSSTAHFALNQINATYNVSGAVDEDHRQLSLLQDETSQTLVMIDRLLTEVSDAVQRQTSYVANERGSLSVLNSAIKDGELYGGTPGITAQAASSGIQLASAGTPLVVIRFDSPNVDYQQILYAALNQALQNRPNAGFEVVAVSPTRGNAASVQTAQTAAARYAQQVVRSMTGMGVPATRMAVSSATDPGTADNEVRVFVR